MPPPSCMVIHCAGYRSDHQVFSPDLADGRGFGANQHVSIELVLAPETVQRLKEALQILPSMISFRYR